MPLCSKFMIKWRLTISEATFSVVFLSFCEFGRSCSLTLLLCLTCCHTITTHFPFLLAWSGNFNSWHIWASITVTSAPSSCWNKSDYDTWHIWTSTAATTTPFSCWFRVFSWPFWAFTSTKSSPSFCWSSCFSNSSSWLNFSQLTRSFFLLLYIYRSVAIV